MSSFFKDRRGVSTPIFGAVVAVLVIVAAVGFGLYGSTSSKTVTSTNTVTSTSVSTEMLATTEMMSSSESMTVSSMSGMSQALSFTPKSGAMLSDAWLLAEPTGMMHEYAVSIHAEGLESNGTYLVEGALTTGTMAMVPISNQSMNMNSTSASEFQADKNGTGNYFIVLDNSPAITFESVQLFFLPGMSMQNETLVASVSFSLMMSNSSETMMSGSSETMMTTSTTGG